MKKKYIFYLLLLTLVAFSCSEENLPLGFIETPHQTEIWVSNQDKNKIQVFNEKLEMIAEMNSSGGKPGQGIFTPDGKYFYIVNQGVEGTGQPSNTSPAEENIPSSPNHIHSAGFISTYQLADHIVVDPNTETNLKSSMVNKFDTSTKSIVKTFSVPYGKTNAITFRPGDLSEVWCNNLSAGFFNLSEINIAHGEVITEFKLPADSVPVNIAFNKEGTKLYYIDTAKNAFMMFDVSKGVSMGVIMDGQVEGIPSGLQRNSSGDRILVTVGVNSEGKGNLVGYLMTGHDMFHDMTSYLGQGILDDPQDIKDTPDGKIILVANRGAKQLLILNANFNQIDDITFDFPIENIAIDRTGKYAFLTLNNYGLAKIDLAEYKIVKTVPVAGTSYEIAVNYYKT